MSDELSDAEANIASKVLEKQSMADGVPYQEAYVLGWQECRRRAEALIEQKNKDNSKLAIEVITTAQLNRELKERSELSDHELKEMERQRDVWASRASGYVELEIEKSNTFVELCDAHKTIGEMAEQFEQERPVRIRVEKMYQTLVESIETVRRKAFEAGFDCGLDDLDLEECYRALQERRQES